MKIRFTKPVKWYYIFGYDLDINLPIPNKWNDLTDFQIRMIGRFMFNNLNVQVETVLLKKIMLSILIVPKPTFRNIIKSVIYLSQVPFSELEQYTDFIFDKKQHLTVFPIFLKLGRWPWSKKVYGPGARLSNVTIEELSYADAFYYKWVTEKDVNDLHRLCAILYRPKAKNPDINDVRIPFSSLRLDKNATLTDRISLERKFMIACAFEGCREVIINRHPNVFPRKKITEGEEPKKETKPKPYQSLSKIIDALAMDEVQIFGNHQQTEKVYASKFLAVYEESIIRQREKERNRNSK